MTASGDTPNHPRGRRQFSALLAGANFSFSEVEFKARRLEANQILRQTGHNPTLDHRLVQLTFPGTRSFDDDETVDLKAAAPKKLVVGFSDRLFAFSIDDVVYELPFETIGEATLRMISCVDDSKVLFVENKDTPDRKLDVGDTVSLEGRGVERFYSKPKSYEINVQGVSVFSPTSEIVVSDALIKAGVDPDEGWIAILKIAGEPSKTVALTDIIDLSNPGIEKLRLRPDEINNGEASLRRRRDFALLDKDEEFLNLRHPCWETHIKVGRRWLILPNYPVPSGYTHETTDVAIDVPATYPSANLDMFFCLPHLSLVSGVEPAQTQSRVQIGGQSYQQWSRHLNGTTKWNPATDSVISHIAMIDECLEREVPDS